MFEDHSAATFRVRKALVPEEILFASMPDVNKDAACKCSGGRRVFVQHVSALPFHMVCDSVLHHRRNHVARSLRRCCRVVNMTGFLMLCGCGMKTLMSPKIQFFAVS